MAPILKLNLELLLVTLYLHQNKNDQGFPSKENLKSGSKLNLFEEKFKLIIDAGFSNEKEGTNEIPLFVTEIFPEIFIKLSCE